MPVYDTPLITNDQSLDRVLHAGLPVALVFWDGHANPRGLDATLDAALKDSAHQAGGKLARGSHGRGRQSGQRLTLARQPPARHRGPQRRRQRRTRRAAYRDLLKRYVAYLLGTGERPQPQAAPSASNGNGASQAHSTAASADLTHPVQVTDATFQHEVLDSRVPVVVDFWAPWCGPCRMIAPALEKIAAEMGGRVKIAKVNVDENQRYAGQYGVQGIPTLLLVRDGKIADRLVGALPEPALRQRIQTFVS